MMLELFQTEWCPASRRDGDTHISAVDAERMLSIVGNERLAPIAVDVKRRLAGVVGRASGRNGRS
jgi:hypothetical protein